MMSLILIRPTMANTGVLIKWRRYFPLLRRLSILFKLGSSTAESMSKDLGVREWKHGYRWTWPSKKLNVFYRRNIISIFTTVARNTLVCSFLKILFVFTDFLWLQACNAYHLPIHVSPHIEIVTPSIYFDTVLKKRGSASLPAKKIGLPGVGHTPKTTGKIKTLFKDLKNCDKMITPLCLRVLYGFFYQPSASDKNTFGIGGLTSYQSIVIQYHLTTF